MAVADLPSSYVEHFEFSPDGQWTAFTILRGYSDGDAYAIGDVRKLPGGIPTTLLRGDIWVARISTGEIRRLTNGLSESRSFWHPSWSPDSRSLAFYGTLDGSVKLWTCPDVADPASCRPHPDVPLKAALFSNDYPRWLSEGQSLVLPLIPTDEDYRPGIDDNPLYTVPRLYSLILDPKAGPTASVLKGGEKDLLTHFLTLENRIDLALYDWKTGKLSRVTEGLNIQRWDLSPDRRFLAFRELKEVLPGSQEKRYALSVFDLQSRRRVQLLDSVQHVGMWSPEGRRLLELSKEGLVIVDVSSGDIQQLKIPAKEGLEKIQRPDDFPDAGINFFLGAPEGEQVMARGREGWWSISVQSGKAEPVLRQSDVEVSAILRDPRGGAAAARADGRILVQGSDKQDRLQFYAWDLKGGLKEIPHPARRHGSVHDLFLGETPKVLFNAVSGNSAELWLGELSSGSFRQLTDIGSGLDHFSGSETRLIRYRDAEGRELTGALLLPTGYEPGRRYPLVCNVYAGISVQDAATVFRLSFNPVGSIPRLLATLGYAVLVPSIPLTPTGQKSAPAREIPGPILSAVEKAVEMGVADPDRVGIMGQSYGGYTVLNVITQTNRFKTAVAMAGISNLISLYGTFDARSRHSWGRTATPNWAEKMQGRMGVPIWEDRSNWMENSPVFYLDRVKTPLLLMHGDLDFVGIEQAEQVFTGLERLGKPVEFVRYFGEGHVLSKPANIRDSWHRIVSWLDRHLAKGE